MKRYTCSICGYVYNEAEGNPKAGIPPGTKWEDLPDDWVCPMCGAPKVVFDAEENNEQPQAEAESEGENTYNESNGLSFIEMSALCSNLSKSCEKQHRFDEAGLFNKLSEYFKSKSSPVKNKGLGELEDTVLQDISVYPKAKDIVTGENDRGALRSLVWSEKVTNILKTILLRYSKKQDGLLEDTNIYVCEICGFVYIGDEPPEICPVCKAPRIKISQIKRR